MVRELLRLTVGTSTKGSPVGSPHFSFTSETQLVLPRYTQLNWLDCEILVRNELYARTEVKPSELEEKKIKDREERRTNILGKFRPEVRAVTKIPCKFGSGFIFYLITTVFSLFQKKSCSFSKILPSICDA